MEARPEKWSLPRPEKVHHVVEDFLTDWTAPSAHLLPLRRFLENCLQTDLRAFYAGLYKECMGSVRLLCSGENFKNSWESSGLLLSTVLPCLIITYFI